MSNLPQNIGSKVNTTKGGVLARADTSSTATTGTGFDRTGYASCVLTLNAGVATGSPSTGTVAAKLQHCDTVGGSYADYTPPTGSASIAAVDTTSAGSFNAVNIDLTGAKQFVAAKGTTVITGGSSPTVPYGITLAMGGAVTEPA